MGRRTLVAVVALTLVLAGCPGLSVPATPGGTQQPTAGTASPELQDDPGVPAGGQTWQATVTRVVDGDTVEIAYANGTADTVRLVGVDTPETRGGTNPGEFGGVPENGTGRACLADAADRATAALESWAGNTQVTLVHDPRTDVRDRYDRLLAYVVIDDSALNYRLVARGHARVYDTPFTRAEAYYAAETDARDAGRGLWTCADPASRDGSGDLGVRVVADAPGNDNENPNGEFVVLSNRADEPRAIGGWTVEDEADHTYSVPADATIPADGSVRIHTGSGTDNATALYWGEDSAVWNNDGDTVTVRDGNGTVVVRESY